MIRAREINRRNPLTAEQVSALKVDDKVRDIPDRVHHVHGIVDVDGHHRLYVLRTWSKRRHGWCYDLQPAFAMAILYTPEK